MLKIVRYRFDVFKGIPFPLEELCFEHIRFGLTKSSHSS